MKKMIMLIVFCAAAFAQDVAKVIEVKYLEPGKLNNLFMTFGVRAALGPTPQTVVVSGSKEAVALAEEAVRKLDIPKKNVEVTFHILQAGPQGGAGKLSADLEPVVKQLRNSFSFQGYKVLDILVIRSREGEGGDVSSFLNVGTDSPPAILNCRFGGSAILDTSVHLKSLRFGAKIPYKSAKDSFQYVETGVSADIDVRSGQKVVVGKANLDGREGAFFLVVTAKIVE